jgi:hypothetical protein
MIVCSNCTQRAQKIRHEDAFAEDTTSITHDNDLPLVDNAVRSKSKCMIFSNSTSMARTKESLTVDAEGSFRENNTSLLNKNSRMCTVQPQGVLKELNTGFAAAISRDSPETDQMTTEREGGGFRREIGSNLFRQITRASFASSLDLRSPPTLPTPIPRSRSPSTSRRPSSPAPAEDQPEWQSDLVTVDFGLELKSAVDSILQAYPKYIGFIV